jgi:hypothetical protein
MSTTEQATILISGVRIPDSKLAQEATELVRDTESPLLFNHSTRVYYFGALAGKQRGLKFDPELLYIGAMFHDMGLTPRYSSKTDRFEVDGANSARAFLRQHKIPEQDIDAVWTAIALHTTPGIPQYMHPVIALVTAGVEMDVLGIGYSDFAEADRKQSSERIRGLPTSKKTSFERSTTASNISRKQRLAMSKQMFLRTKILLSGGKAFVR